MAMKKAGASKAKLLFFVGCPKCKHKFGVEPKYIGFFIKRMRVQCEELGLHFTGAMTMLDAAQEAIKPKTKEES